MKNMIADMRDKSSEFDDLLYNPSVMFTKHYIEQSKKYLDISKNYLIEVKNARDHVDRSYRRFSKNCEAKLDSEQEIEARLKDHEEGLITFDRIQEISNKALNVKYKTEVSFQEYKQDVEYLNSLVADTETNYLPSLKYLQHHEERRINFVKYMMEKFLSFYSQCGTIMLAKDDKYNDSVKMINYYTDLQIFVDENRSRIDKDSILSKVAVKLYEPKHAEPISIDNASTDASSFDIEDLNLPSREEIETNIKFVRDKIKSMIRHQIELSMEDKADLLTMVHQREVNHRISEELKTITDVKEYHVLHDLSDIVNYMITESISDKHNDFKIINNILSIASSIYCRKSPEGVPQIRKIFLTDLLKNHAIWTDTNRWKTWIYLVIEEKKKESVNKKKKSVNERYKKLKKETYDKDPNAGMMSRWISRVTKPLTAFELDNEQRREIEQVEEDGLDNKTHLNIIFNVLSSYLRHLSQFGVTLDISKTIMLYFCERYELDKDRTQLILSELESTYTKEGFSEKEQMKIRLRKLSQLSKDMQNEKMLLLYHISDYIGDDSTLIKVLGLNKNSNTYLKQTVYRR
jgi:hypothetical protein